MIPYYRTEYVVDTDVPNSQRYSTTIVLPAKTFRKLEKIRKELPVCRLTTSQVIETTIDYYYHELCKEEDIDNGEQQEDTDRRTAI